VTRRVAFAVALAAVYLALAISGVLLGKPDEVAIWGVIGVAFLPTVIAGGLIVVLRPGNRVGWLFCAIGSAFAASVFLYGYGYRALDSGWPGSAYAGWLGNITFISYWTPAILLLLLFPTGGLPSARWRPVAMLVLGSAAVTTIGLAFGPARVEVSGQLVPNPLVAPGWIGPLLATLGGWTNQVLIALLPLTAGGLVVRLRRSEGVERQQLKWFVYAGALISVSLIGGALAPLPLANIAYVCSLIAVGAGLPIAASIAILRYRLFEIDLVISRTISWAIVTGGVVAIYLGAVVVLETVLGGLTQGDTLAVAASTLLAAAAFQPLRQGIQRVVDRRFHRSRYDAERTAAALADRLRDEVEMHALREALAAAVDRSVRPARLGLWLRQGAGEAE
jgi:hypothetical protein